MRKPVRLAVMMVFGLMLAACAIVNRQYHYWFTFNNQYDGQTALVLDYKVKSDDQVLTRAHLDQMPILARTIYIIGPRPTSIYVKWKEPSSGAEYERVVDLRKTLIDDLGSQTKTIYLMFKDGRLSIYLISDDLRLADEPLIGPRYASEFSRKVIYSE